MSQIRIAVAAVAFLSLAAGGTRAAQTPGRFGPATLQPDTDENLQTAASVMELTNVPNQGDASVTLFGTGGGDPAMNGLYVYLSFYSSPADGWRVFSLGDILDYRIASATPGRLVLQFRESTNNEGGVIGTSTRRVVVRWTPGADGAPPATVTMGPAR